MSERDIFAAAVERTDPAARSAYLDEACGGDPALRARVEILLRAHDRPDSLLDVPAFSPPDPDAAPTHALQTAETDPTGGPTRTHGEGTGGEPAEDMSFLSPPRRPGSLGRIGHYEVLEVLGSGGFGIVFRAFDDKLQRVVAVKVLAPAMAATSPARKRFVREARSAALIQHQNVVRVHAVEEQPLPYLVMEFIAGETLQQQLDRTGPLDVPEVLRIGRQLADGLAAAHAAGLVHRDIKPANVLIEGGPLRVVKLTDFGLARAADDASISQSGVVVGTPMYMAPEQAKGDTLDHRADLFSLGSVLYVMLTGRPPFRASGTLGVLKRVCEENPRPIREVIPETPDWVCRIIEKLHAKDPAGRFQTAREVADLLADCEAQLKAHGGLRDFARIPGGSPPRGGRWRWPAVAAMVLLLPLVAWGVYALTRPERQPDPQPEVADRGKTAPPIATPPDQTTEDWVQLFNGKDLTGWKPIATQPGDWRVENGELVGRGPAVSHLMSERGDFENFHLRAEVKLNAAGNSGIYFHCSSLLQRGIDLPEGIECEINQSLKMPTGSFTTIGKGAFHPAAAPSPPADSWVVLEIQVQRQQITVKVNERPVIIDFPLGAYSGHGYLALQVHAPQTEVRFRKIEIKELPPTPPLEPQWVPLFNGKDLTGWMVKDTEQKAWEVIDGTIKGRATEPQAWLWSSRADYRDFHLRVETRVLGACESGILFRHGPQKGYEAEVRPNFKEVTTGSLWRYADFKVLAKAAAPAPKPGEWFTLEVIARGSRLQVLVNGHTTADVADATSAQGSLALQSIGKSGGVEFRKIEIKELPASANRVVIKYSKTGGGESSIRLDGRLVTRGELFQRLEKLVARNARLKVSLTGDIDPEADPEQDDFRPLLNAIAGAGVDVKNIEFDPGVREKAERVASSQQNVAQNRIKRTNDLKEIGKSLQSYHDQNQSFPPSRSAPAKQFDKEGKPLLSWRVHLLPYLGEVELYKKFRLDEPWDSEHNKKLLADNPDWFKTTADPEKTTYLAVVGTGTAYEGKAGLTLADFKDGASNTAYVVDAGPEKAVPWTKPEDLPFDPEDPIRAIGSSEFGDIFLALMTDGGVKSIPRDVAPESLRALFTRSANDRFDESAKRKTPLPPAIDPYLWAATEFAEKLAKSGKMYGAKTASVGEFVGAPAGFREALERGLKAHGLEVVPPTGDRPRNQLRVFGSLDDVRAPGNHTPVQMNYEWKGGAGGGKGSFDVVGARPRAPGLPPAVAPPPRPRP